MIQEEFSMMLCTNIFSPLQCLVYSKIHQMSCESFEVLKVLGTGFGLQL